MKYAKLVLPFLILPFLSAIGCAQPEGRYILITKPCEGCEAIFEYKDLGLTLNPIDTLPDFNHKGPKLKLTGTIYKSDGVTPAKGVILYVYHTNQEGIYATKGDEIGWGRRHGYTRGWIKTGADGKYTFYTLLPGHYPNRQSPRHIHPTILEPDGKYYYIASWHFADDPLLTEDDIYSSYGGSGVVTLRKEGNFLIAERDIILGLNIPNYSDGE